MRSTTPVGFTLSWQEYCEALGVDPTSARQASVVKALHDKIKLADRLIEQSIATLK